MQTELFLGIYWQNRKLTQREAIHRVLGCLNLLRKYKPDFFTELYGAGWGKKDTLSKRISFTYDSLRTHLFDKRRKEDGYYSMGTYIATVLNRKEGDEHMSVSAGIGTDCIRLYNRVIVRFPRGGAMYDYYVDPSHQLELLHLLADYWQPEDAQIINEATQGERKYIKPPFTLKQLTTP